MENSNLTSDEKRLILKDYNHRLNNDLQALLAFIKLKKRFEIDNDEIINFSYVSIASISAIQNMMYYADNEDNLISVNGFFEDFIKILNDYYFKSNIQFSNEIENDFPSFGIYEEQLNSNNKYILISPAIPTTISITQMTCGMSVITRHNESKRDNVGHAVFFITL